MAVFSTCKFCSHKAEYYCKQCHTLLCRDHISIYNTLYHCDKCDIDNFESICSQCGNELIPTRHEEVIKCNWCGSLEVTDAISYYRHLPHLILASYERLDKELSRIWLLTQRYINTVKTLFDIRSSKIMLFSFIEDELSLLKNAIDNFIDQLNKFENDIFTNLEKKLQQITYLRMVNFNFIRDAEEILKELNLSFDRLKAIIDTKSTEIEKRIATLDEKMQFLKFQYNHLSKIFTFIPEKEEEELITIIPRVLVVKNHGLPKKYLLVFTNKNIYFLREKGLIKVRLKASSVLPLSLIVSYKYENSFLFGKKLLLKTDLDTYQIMGRLELIEQCRYYFEIANNYYKHSANTISLIKELAYDTVTIKDLAFKVKLHLKLLNAKLMNQKDVLREINYRKMLDTKEQKLIDKLLAITRKIDEYLYNPPDTYPSSQGRAGILNRLKREQLEITRELEKLREEARRFDSLFGIT